MGELRRLTEVTVTESPAPARLMSAVTPSLRAARDRGWVICTMAGGRARPGPGTPPSRTRPSTPSGSGASSREPGELESVVNVLLVDTYWGGGCGGWRGGHSPPPRL